MIEKWSNPKIGSNLVKKTQILGPLILNKNPHTYTRVEYPMDPNGFLVFLARCARSKNQKPILEEMLSSKTGFWLVLFLFKKSTFCSKSVLIDQKVYFLLKKSTFFKKSLFWSKNPYFGQKNPYFGQNMIISINFF